MRVHYGTKLAHCSDKLVRIHYLEKYQHHTSQMEQLNSMAADAILAEFQERHGNANDLDLHHLYVHEALTRLREHLEVRNRNKTIPYQFQGNFIWHFASELEINCKLECYL
jgi:hypothetical protein